MHLMQELLEYGKPPALNIEQVVDIQSQLLQALHYVHERGTLNAEH